MTTGASTPVDIVVFGGTGDLARRKLLPALYFLVRDGLIPAKSRIIGVSRTQWSREEYIAKMEAHVRRHVSGDEFQADAWNTFARMIFNERVDGEKPETFDKIKGHVQGNAEQPSILYLATDPSLFGPICANLGARGLATPSSRVVLEKPIGHDLQSAKEINNVVGSTFDEHQVFRIDHYLGKETVQNLMALRFSNALFEPIWRRGYIDHVQITVAETVGVGERGDYYEQSGALRDMVQNHLLQLLCLVAMEPSTSLDQDLIRDEKRQVLRALRPIAGPDIPAKTVRAQYDAGAIDGEPVCGYIEENGVDPESNVESYVALHVEVDNWRWAGVPFYLRTGKRMQQRVSEIIVQFRPVPHLIFEGSKDSVVPNRLIITLQPEEGIKLTLMAKQPGRGMTLRPVALNLDFADAFSRRSPSAYERLLLDVALGDATLFMRRDEVEAAWTWVDSILNGWNAQNVTPESYVSGSWGPSKAVRLLAANGHSWHEEWR